MIKPADHVQVCNGDTSEGAEGAAKRAIEACQIDKFGFGCSVHSSLAEIPNWVP